MVEINRDLRADKQINKHLLDEEAEMQPYVYGEWAMLVINAKEDADRAKLNLDKVKAERFMFHKTPDEPEGKVPTDKLAESLTVIDEEVMEAQKAFIVANKVHGYCRVAEESMQQKRSMIKVLEQLHTSKYFIREEMSTDIRKNKVKTRDAVSEAMDLGVSEMNKKRKKKKKGIPITGKEKVEAVEKEPEEEEEEEELYDETEGIGTSDPDLDVDMDEDENEDEEEEVVLPKPKRSVKTNATKGKLKAQKNKKRTVKEQAEINITEGKKLQKEIADKKKDKPKGKCPSGYEFGTSFGLEPECDECEIDNTCYKARPKE